MSVLSLQASQVKRTLLNRAENGIYLDKKITKTEVMQRLAKGLKLSSHRSLYDGGEREKFINKWFNKLLEEISVINDRLNNTSETNVNTGKYKSVEELINLLEHERMLRKAYETRIQNLMKENEVLRTEKLNRFMRIDNLDDIEYPF